MTTHNAEDGTEEEKQDYKMLVNPKLLDILKEKVEKVVIADKRYKDRNFSVKKLAEELHTNTRYISATMRMRFNKNYTSFINGLRVEDAKAILSDKRFADLKMDEVGYMVGFANRQSFYTSFTRVTGKTPLHYRKEALADNRHEKEN